MNRQSGALVFAGIVAPLVVAVLLVQHRAAERARDSRLEPTASSTPPNAPPDPLTEEPAPQVAESTTASASPPPPEPAVEPSLDEATLLAELRPLVDVAPARAYELAKQGLKQFPNSPNAPEMAALAVKSLARQGKRSEARGEAETMVNQYPDSPWARDVERHTGAHPHRDQRAP